MSRRCTIPAVRSARLEYALDALGAADTLRHAAAVHEDPGSAQRVAVLAIGARPTHIPCAEHYADELAELREAAPVVERAACRARRTRRLDRADELERAAAKMRCVLAWFRRRRPRAARRPPPADAPGGRTQRTHPADAPRGRA